MDANVKKAMLKRAEIVVKALEANNMKGYIVENAMDAEILIAELIKDDKLITSGGTMTLEQTGIKAFLKENYEGIYLDRDDAKPEEIYDVMRKAFYADTYFTSTNAITEQGELYNVDGNGNRVSAMLFGPKQVIVVAGLNKIVTDIETAIDRVETVASPANCIRLERHTPCTKLGRCADCSSPDRICNEYTVIAKQRDKDRIKVIFIADEYGY